ncbi:BppU family phage baseplate upper protein [Staphylococcus epidermidis]|uniref:BppU family phage baseplate upper protein n=1 Tax=Staphylococcus epidermidis TaxID=1282 RepID=UPI00241CC25C|nr:BppU family phage baseplate upper protein [Staphylococcus epidermidis]
MELEKVGKLDLNEEPYLQPISNRGIGFYNLDKNTAKFQFVVQKDNKPLLISDKNVKGYAFFKAANGTEEKRPSTSGVLDVEFIDPMKGLIGVTVPQWFLKNVVDSEVLGEIYLSLNDVNNVGKDDTVVLGTFKFTVRDSLINQIESDIKVSYIRMFDDLRTELEKKVQQLKQDIGDTQTLIESIKQTAEEYLVKINKAQADALIAITDALLTSNQSIDLEREEALRQIDSKRDAIKTDYDLASDSFQKLYDSNIQSFNTNVNDANTTIDGKVSSFKELLDNDGFTTPSDVEQKFTEADWQKYKLTSEKGESISVDLENNIDNLDKLEPGFYYITNTPGVPYAKSFAGTALVIKRDKNSVKQVIFFPFTTNSVYINSYYNNWSGWQQVGGTIKDTGWLDLQLVNNASPNNELVTKGGFTSAYRTITQNGITKKMLRINATTIKHGQTIALLPKEFVKNLMFFSISAPRNKNSGRISLNTSGTVNFDATVDPSAWTDTDYIYGQYEWTE